MKELRLMKAPLLSPASGCLHGEQWRMQIWFFVWFWISADWFTSYFQFAIQLDEARNYHQFDVAADSMFHSFRLWQKGLHHFRLALLTDGYRSLSVSQVTLQRLLVFYLSSRKCLILICNSKIISMHDAMCILQDTCWSTIAKSLACSQSLISALPLCIPKFV
jgi:hypothetical protein